MMLSTKYDFGDFVYLVTDKEQSKRQIVGIEFYPSGIVYVCYCGTVRSEHYEFELSVEPDLIFKTSD